MKVLTPTGAPKVQRQDFIPFIPRARARIPLTGQAIPATAQTLVSLTLEDYDTDVIHDLATNPDRLTIKTAGFYRISAWIQWASAATNTSIRLQLYKNGSPIKTDWRYNITYGTGTNPTNEIELLEECAVGDYFQVYAYQDHSAPRNISDAMLSAVLVGPGFQATRYAKQVFYVTPAQFASLSPIDGDEAYITVDATNGVIWHFRYNANSSSAYKWEFLGGMPMRAVISAVGFNNSAITRLSGLVTPRAGEYEASYLGNYQGTANRIENLYYNDGANHDNPGISQLAYQGSWDKAVYKDRLILPAGATVGPGITANAAGDTMYNSWQFYLIPTRIS